MTLRRDPPRLRALLLVAVLAPAVVPAPASAQADGTWRCWAVGNIPLATLVIAGADYALVMTDRNFGPRDDPANGPGVMVLDGSAVTPANGPLVDNFGVTGIVSSDGRTIVWSDLGGQVMECRL